MELTNTIGTIHSDENAACSASVVVSAWYDRYGTDVLRLCFMYMRNLADAEDALQETFLKIWRKLDRYEGVPYTDRDGKTTTPVVNDIVALSEFSGNAQWADLVGHIGYDKQHREVFNFGKHKGKTLEQVFNQEPAYYDWMMKADFPLSTKQVVMQVQRRIVEEKRRKDQEKLQALKLKFEG